jgi:hypothetical protein
MVRQIEDSDFVVAVITETYARRFSMREELGVGRGVTWEGAVINSQIYDNFGGRTKFIPVVFEQPSRKHIPFPLSQTSSYVVDCFTPELLAPLLRQLYNAPAIKPATLGRYHAKESDEISEAVSLASVDVERSIDELSRLADSSDHRIASRAAFHLGEILFGDQQYSRAISAYRFTMELGPSQPGFSDAEKSLLSAAKFIQRLYGPGSARAALQDWLSLVQNGKMREAWKITDRDLRLSLAQDWILANNQHPNLIGFNRDDLAVALSALEPSGKFAEPFLSSQLRKFQNTYQHIDLADWGAAERQRRFKIEYELVILSPTKGEFVTWEGNTSLRATVFILRRRLHDWHIAGFGDEIAVPGWPPRADKFPLEGVTFRGDPLPPGSKHFLNW